MSRHPTPPELRLLDGNPGKRRVEGSSPQRVEADLTPPASLEGVAREKWIEVAPILKKSGVFTAADRGTLERYCHVWEQWVVVSKHVRENGLTQITSTGYSQLSAEGALFRSLPGDLLKIEKEMGMTPSSRSSLKVGNAETAEDPLDAYLSKRSG